MDKLSVFDRLYYRANRNKAFIAVNSAVAFLLSVVLITLAVFFDNPLVVSFGLFLLLYCFFSMGKTAGL
nr:hypothetical protein [Candidatus Goldiibacteriota bacterium]